MRVLYLIAKFYRTHDSSDRPFTPSDRIWWCPPKCANFHFCRLPLASARILSGKVRQFATRFCKRRRCLIGVYGSKPSRPFPLTKEQDWKESRAGGKPIASNAPDRYSCYPRDFIRLPLRCGFIDTSFHPNYPQLAAASVAGTKTIRSWAELQSSPVWSLIFDVFDQHRPLPAPRCTPGTNGEQIVRLSEFAFLRHTPVVCIRERFANGQSDFVAEGGARVRSRYESQQIKAEIRKLSGYDKIGIYRWLNEEVAIDRGIGADRSLQAQRRSNV
jgi:hypothetical protein